MDYLQYIGEVIKDDILFKVLNLVINGLPSIHFDWVAAMSELADVLNLVINGLPSIQNYV